MQTNGLFGNSSSTSSSDPTTAVAGNTLSQTQDMFTKLLVAQIKNQDPLSPSDPSQFVNQLTQLSQTESLQNLSTLTSNNASVLQSMQVLALGAQVGSDLSVTADTVQLGTDKISGQIEQTNASNATNLTLTGSDGTAHTIALGAQGAGPVAFTLDPVALGLPAGSYKITAATDTKETPAVDIAGRLNSVRVSPNGIVLNVANIGDTTPSYVTAFNGKTATATQ